MKASWGLKSKTWRGRAWNGPSMRISMSPRTTAGLPIEVNSKIGLKSTNLSHSACPQVPTPSSYHLLLFQWPLNDPSTPNTPTPQKSISALNPLDLKMQIYLSPTTLVVPKLSPPQWYPMENLHTSYKYGISWLKRNRDFRDLCPFSFPCTWPSVYPWAFMLIFIFTYIKIRMMANTFDTK